ncbi:hypothetical protein EV424DRAFT_1534281 [Suillus variegatus]|nr:hypothetical protein EV424DRAFT_1534281 [Suillus variegatus]
MQPSVFELLNTSDDRCAFIFKHQVRGGNHVYVESNDRMRATFEASGDRMIYTESPSIIATHALYNDRAEFNRIANLIANDPGTSVVYAESLGLAEDLVNLAFNWEGNERG